MSRDLVTPESLACLLQVKLECRAEDAAQAEALDQTN